MTISTTPTNIPADLLTCVRDTITAWNSNSESSSQWPTALQIYQIGKLLAKLDEETTVRSSLRQLLNILPESHVLEPLRDGLFHVLETNDSNSNTREECLAAIAEIYHLAPRIPDLTSERVTLLQTTYHESYDTNIVRILALFLLKHQLPWEDYLPLLHQLHEDPTWNDLIDWFQDHAPGWQQTLLEKHPDHADYLQLLWQPTDDVAKVAQISPVSLQHQQATTIVEPGVELQRRIHQVLQVVPDLGEGFVELCLSYYKGDVEQTVAALVDMDHLPPALRLYDRNLPRRRIEGRNKEIEEEEAKQIAKAALQAAQRQQEEDAYMLDMVMRQGAHDEYNDDYDDQYDATEGNRRASDEGLYDNYDAVRTYNRVLKGIVEEQAFWEDDRNTNHQQRASSNTKVAKEDAPAENEKTFRGADKLKGGRIPNAGRGGRSGRDGRPSNKKDTPTESATNGDSSTSNNNTSDNRSKGNQRAKERKLANRREKQKTAAAKRMA
jgi:hypothetical protein